MCGWTPRLLLPPRTPEGQGRGPGTRRPGLRAAQKIAPAGGVAAKVHPPQVDLFLCRRALDHNTTRKENERCKPSTIPIWPAPRRPHGCSTLVTKTWTWRSTDAVAAVAAVVAVAAAVDVAAVAGVVAAVAARAIRTIRWPTCSAPWRMRWNPAVRCRKRSRSDSTRHTLRPEDSRIPTAGEDPSSSGRAEAGDGVHSSPRTGDGFGEPAGAMVRAVAPAPPFVAPCLPVPSLLRCRSPLESPPLQRHPALDNSPPSGGVLHWTIPWFASSP